MQQTEPRRRNRILAETAFAPCLVEIMVTVSLGNAGASKAGRGQIVVIHSARAIVLDMEFVHRVLLTFLGSAHVTSVGEDLRVRGLPCMRPSRDVLLIAQGTGCASMGCVLAMWASQALHAMALCVRQVMVVHSATWRCARTSVAAKVCASMALAHVRRVTWVKIAPSRADAWFLAMLHAGPGRPQELRHAISALAHA